LWVQRKSKNRLRTTTSWQWSRKRLRHKLNNECAGLDTAVDGVTSHARRKRVVIGGSQTLEHYSRVRSNVFKSYSRGGSLHNLKPIEIISLCLRQEGSLLRVLGAVCLEGGPPMNVFDIGRSVHRLVQLFGVKLDWQQGCRLNCGTGLPCFQTLRETKGGLIPHHRQNYMKHFGSKPGGCSMSVWWTRVIRGPMTTTV